MIFTLKIKGDMRTKNNTVYSFETLKKAWLDKVGTKTDDGDLISEVIEISDDEIEVKLQRD